MDLGIKGKRAVLVGATSGLGLTVAHTLAGEGVDLVFFSRDEARLRVASADISARYSVRTTGIAGDMTIKSDVVKLREFLEPLGADILFLNTARPPSPMREVLEEKDDERWDLAYNTQLWGGILILREIVPLLVEKGWGRVVAITSASVKQPMSKHALSTVYRAGLTAYLKHLANEVAPRGVTVNSVCPASILTEGLKRDHNLDARRQAVPMKRLGDPYELASTVVFFMSKNAGFITGASLQVDGGMTAALY